MCDRSKTVSKWIISVGSGEIRNINIGIKSPSPILSKEPPKKERIETKVSNP